jgi:hypothetical protein
VDEKWVIMVSDGPQGPSILYSDGSTEPVPSDDVEPPPLFADISFEETRAGFEVWLSERIVRDHDGLIEGFTDWLREQPEVALTDDDTLGVVQVKGALSEDLRTDMTAWWASRAKSLELGS